jgi:hypothetical protein
MLLHLTVDHQVMFSWAQRRGARPATCEDDERPWPLFFELGPADSFLKEISWDNFFAEFGRANLAFIYRDISPNGELDDWHRFVKRVSVPQLVITGKSTIIVDW